MKSRMRFEPGARLQAVVAREIIDNNENVAGRILRFNVGQQCDVVLRVARGGRSLVSSLPARTRSAPYTQVFSGPRL